MYSINIQLHFTVFFAGPYVTVVGGTTDMFPEVAAYFSGGGFSNIFPRPPYQDDAVTTFLQRFGSQYNGLYRASGRAIPDISAQSTGFFYVLKDLPEHGSGTSAAAPVNRCEHHLAA